MRNNKLAIGSIFGAAVLIAGIFALMPVEEASTQGPPQITPVRIVAYDATAPVQEQNPVTKTSCDPANVVHFDKIMFNIKTTLVDIREELPDLRPRGGPYEVKVEDNPDEVVRVKQAVADKLDQVGYRQPTEFPGVFTVPNPSMIRTIEDIEYAIVCIDREVKPQT